MALLSIALKSGAPVIELIISASSSHLQSLARANQAYPELQHVAGLIDTGASSTCIDLSLVDRLGLESAGESPVLTVGTGKDVVGLEAYYVGLILLSGANDRLILPNTRVLAADLSAHDYQVLLGRDVLARCLLVYDGKHQSMTLAY